MDRAVINFKTENLRRFRVHIDEGFRRIAAGRVIGRIWRKDGTVWTSHFDSSSREIAHRLAWLTAPEDSEKDIARITAFADEVRREGFTRAIILGMGGSSLAPEVFGSVFKTRKGYLDLNTLDSTDPAAVLRAAEAARRGKTLFIVSSKSGTTVETASFMNYFFHKAMKKSGQSGAGACFAAITDRGTPLEDIARRLEFRAIFHGNPEIGGRYSALSAFGLVPAALKGIEISRLLEIGRQAAEACRKAEPRKNPGAFLGGHLAALAGLGITKATLLIARRLRSFGAWLEQLIAESTGKGGLGILPVPEQATSSPQDYGLDRYFIVINMESENPDSEKIGKLAEAGFPVISLTLRDPHELGAWFFVWEFATAVAGALLGINPFVQPDVDSAKKNAREFLDAYRKTGVLPDLKSAMKRDNVSWRTSVRSGDLECDLESFLKLASPGGYVAIQAFIDPSAENARLLESLAAKIRKKTRLAVTWGFGPRYLHSTGQFHKGGDRRGIFLQMTARDNRHVPIPDRPGSSEKSITFEVLEAAQAYGDFKALIDRGRAVVHIELGKNPCHALHTILSIV